MKTDVGTSIVKLLKTKDKGKTLKTARGKQHFTHRNCELNEHRFLIRNYGGQKRVNNIFKRLKGKKTTCQLRILYPEKICFNNEGKMHFQIKEY